MEPKATAQRTDRRVVLVAVLIFATVSLALNVTSSAFLEADGITHFQYARSAWNDPQLLTDVWGRPVVTTLHLLPAQLPGTLLGQPLSLIGVRAISMLLAIGTAWITWRIAAGQGRAYGHDHAALAALFLLCMPLVILHSIAELTELPFAFLAILALWAYQRRWWWLVALAAGLLPAARPEGFGFALLTTAGLALHRRFLPMLLLPLPLILWDRLGWLQHEGFPGAWWQVGQWLEHNWPYSGQSTYDSGPLLKFVGMLPAVVGPLLMPMVLVGIAASILTRRARAADATTDAGGGAWRDHQVRVAWIIVFVPLLVLVVHSLLHWLGRMASSGDVRYLVSVAPFWALLAALGCDWLSRQLRWRRVYVWAALAAVVPPVAMQLSYPIVPLAPDQPSKDAVLVARWYEQSAWARSHPRLLTDHPIIWYEMNLNPRKSGGGSLSVQEARPGTLFLWHDIYSTHNADARFLVPLDLPPRYGWSDVTPPDLPPEWRAFATGEVTTE